MGRAPYLRTEELVRASIGLEFSDVIQPGATATATESRVTSDGAIRVTSGEATRVVIGTELGSTFPGWFAILPLKDGEVVILDTGCEVKGGDAPPADSVAKEGKPLYFFFTTIVLKATSGVAQAVRIANG